MGQEPGRRGGHCRGSVSQADSTGALDLTLRPWEGPIPAMGRRRRVHGADWYPGGGCCYPGLNDRAKGSWGQSGVSGARGDENC